MIIEKIERGPDNETVSTILTLKDMPYLAKDEHLCELYEMLAESMTSYMLIAYVRASEGEIKVYKNMIELIRTISELGEKNLNKNKEE